MNLFRTGQALATAGALLGIGFAQAPADGRAADAAQGAQRFMEYCAGCHGSDRRGGDKAPSLLTGASRSDAEFIGIVRDGTTAGMPPFAQIGDANIHALVRFLRVLENSGAPASTPEQAPPAGAVNAGRSLYFGKARCSECHSIEGKGGFIARSLTTYARNRKADVIRHAILNPDTPLVLSSRVATVRARTGQSLTGVLRNEDNFNLALQTEDGRYHLLARSDLAEVNYTDQSLMPRDYGSRLSSEELNDIVSFLMATGKQIRPKEDQGR